MDTFRGIVGNDTARIICRMKETWMDRAKRRMGILGKTQEDLKAALGVKTRGAVGHYFTGRRDLSTDQVIALADELNYSIDELLTGRQSSASSDISDLPSHIVHLGRCIADTSSDKAKAIQMIANASPEKVKAFLLLFGTEEKDAPKFMTSPPSKIKTPLQEVSDSTPERRKHMEERRQNVQEVDFERRSGFDRRDDRAYIFNKDGKRARRDKNDREDEGEDHGTAS